MRLPLARVRSTAERCDWRPAQRPAAPRMRPEREHSRTDTCAEAYAAAERHDAAACSAAALEPRCRMVRAEIAAEFARRRLWRPLGFGRLGDYAAERLGMSGRSLEEDARVARALASLPVIKAAFGDGAIRWSHLRLLTGVATGRTEAEWLRLALTTTTRRLAEFVKEARRDDGAPSGGGTDVGDVAPGDAAGPDACAPADVSSGASDASAAPGPATDDPLVRWSIVTTRAGRKLWRSLVELAARVSGADVAPSQVAEAVAAEAMSSPMCDPPGPMPPPAAHADRRIDVGASEGFARLAPPAKTQACGLEHLLAGLADADAFEIDARLRTAVAAMQRIDAGLGPALRAIADARLHRVLGFADLRLYAEARLGICGSKAMALVRLERECARRSPLLLAAYRDGRVGWLAASALIPVVSREHERQWIARAGAVTLRRLVADVGWALDRADESNGPALPGPPPPLDLDVTADALSRIDAAEVQMRAHPAADLASFSRRVGATIAVVMPMSVASLVEDAIEGCRRAVEPRWRGFERIMAHAYVVWTALPPHENPVFARDSFRCQVPACTRRGPLHAHHVRFRSDGGPDAEWNLTAVCDEHHREFIHRGTIRVEGHAPDHLVWELGCRPGKPPLVRLRGDVYVRE